LYLTRYIKIVFRLTDQLSVINIRYFQNGRGSLATLRDMCYDAKDSGCIPKLIEEIISGMDRHFIMQACSLCL